MITMRETMWAHAHTPFRRFKKTARVQIVTCSTQTGHLMIL